MRIYLAAPHAYSDMIEAIINSDENLHGRSERFTRYSSGIIRGGGA